MSRKRGTWGALSFIHEDGDVGHLSLTITAPSRSDPLVQ